ncbi:MAG: STAS domain-containing protein [Ignavibacteria bacterium]|nr:STAS domain-containing protein [Ignavibacteria bacterium]
MNQPEYQIQQEANGSARVTVLAGSFDIFCDMDAFSKELGDLAKTCREIAVDLEAVRHIDITTVCALIKIQRLLSKYHGEAGKLVLLNPTKFVGEILSCMHADRILELEYEVDITWMEEGE